MLQSDTRFFVDVRSLRSSTRTNSLSPLKGHPKLRHGRSVLIREPVGLFPTARPFTKPQARLSPAKLPTSAATNLGLQFRLEDLLLKYMYPVPTSGPSLTSTVSIFHTNKSTTTGDKFCPENLPNQPLTNTPHLPCHRPQEQKDSYDNGEEHLSSCNAMLAPQVQSTSIGDVREPAGGTGLGLG